MSRELDIQIAELIFEKTCVPEGYRLHRVIRDRDGEIYDVKPKVTYEPEQLCGTWEGHRLSEAIPRYSTDLNACRLAELRLIELGHHDAYVGALGEIMGATETGITHPVMLICAPAEARCRAMLSVLEEK